jgi:hypothetical protein
VDIYFIIEHKSDNSVEVLIQVLKYMVFEWEKDYNAKKSPRIIIPVVFYHGAKEWKVPRSFVEQFDVDADLKPYLLNSTYVLFDTNEWDFRDNCNKNLKQNVFLFTAMVLLKAAYHNDRETITELFRFWNERGFLENVEWVIFFIKYISQTYNLKPEKLKKMLDYSKIDGGEIMRTLEQRIKEKFKDEVMEEVRDEVKEEVLTTMGPKLKDEGEKEGIKKKPKEPAMQMIKRGFDLNTIIDITGLEKSEIEKLAPLSKSH